MKGMVGKLTPATFILALICFFLPFVTFSCQGQKIASFSALQLVTGTKVEQPQLFGETKVRRVDAEPLAMLALAAVLLGGGLSFLKGKPGGIAAAGGSALGILFVLALKSKLDGDAMRRGSGSIQVDYQIGFYLILIFLLAALAAGAYGLLAARGSPRGVDAAALPEPRASSPVPDRRYSEGAPPGTDRQFCPKCGAPGALDNAFCKKCGAKLG